MMRNVLERVKKIASNPKIIVLYTSLLANALMANLNAQTTIKNGSIHMQSGSFLYTPGLESDGGSIHGEGAIQITSGNWIANSPVMQDTDLIDVTFAGSNHQIIGGSVGTNFYKLTIDNAAGVSLDASVKVRDTLHMNEGVLDLDGQYVDFGLAGILQENASSYTFDNANGGWLKATAVMNNPSAFNPANFGIEITGGGNMDTVEVIRRYMDELSGAGAFLSYEINPQNQPTGSVDVTMYYLPHHVHPTMGNPSDYDIYQNISNSRSPTDGSSDVPNTSVSTVLTGGFGSGLTIGSLGDPLSVNLTHFSVDCYEGFPTLYWQTASEQNSNFFEIQRSIDGIIWESIGSVPAAGYSNDIIDYSFSDTTKSLDDQTWYYRIAEHDNNGYITPYHIVASHCNIPGIDNISVFPNPTSGPLIIQLQSTQHKDMQMSVVDINGKLVDQRDMHTIHGMIQHYADFSHLVDGMYIMKVGDKTMRFIITK